MKKRYGLFLVLCLLALLTCIACTGGGNASDGSGTTGSGTTDSGESVTLPETETDPKPADDSFLTLVENQQTSYKIINATTLLDDSFLARTFAMELGEKTGVTFEVLGVDSPVSEYEIIIGDAPNRVESEAYYNELSYTEYGVRRIGKKLVVGYYHTDTLERSLRILDEKIVANRETGAWGVKGELDFRNNLSTVTVPLFESEGRLQGVYACGERNYMASFEGTTSEEFETYLAKLADEGYTVHDTHEMADNRFGTYIKDKTQISLSHYPTKGLTKIVYGTTKDLPDTERGEIDEVTTPFVTQMGINAADSGSAPGMSYVMRLSDGRFILVDSGTANDTNEAALLAYLQENNPNNGKPVIAAWFITHAHGDHLGLAQSFLDRYHDEVEVEAVAYNFPDFNSVEGLHEDLTFMGQSASRFKTQIRQYYPKAETWILHTGQHFWVGDAEIEVLYTHEDYYPTQIWYGNDTSLAFRVTLGGKKIVYLGDCDPILNQFMADVYKETLKCDILQLAHHGFNGAVLDIYKYCDPDICFWPTDKARFESDPRCLGTEGGYEFNAWIRDESIKVREHYHASVTTKISLGE